MSHALVMILALAFALDSVINTFVQIPAGAIATIIIYLVFLLTSLLKLRKIDHLSAICLFLSIIIFINPYVKNIFFGDLKATDFSDSAFFSLFMLIPIILDLHNKTSTNPNKYKLSILVTALSFSLFVPAIFGYEFASQSQNSNISSDSLDLEFLRAYHQGFFRHPHVASYFFSFIFICLAFKAYTLKNKYLLIASFFFLALIIYTGSRAGLYSIVFALLGMSMTTSNIKIRATAFSCATLFALMSVTVNLREIASILEGTFLYQYVTFFITAYDNFDRLSRVIIWKSWAASIAEFGVIEAFFGKPFSYSAMENLQRIGYPIWFHNDWLNSLYSYGAIGLTSLALSWINLFKKTMDLFENRLLGKTILLMSLFMSLTNGFYYYYPLVLIAYAYCTGNMTLKKSRP